MTSVFNSFNRNSNRTLRAIEALESFHWTGRIASIVFFLILTKSLSAADLTKQDFHYLYDPYSAVGLKHKMTRNNGIYTLYFKLSLKNPIKANSIFEIKLAAQSDYKSKNEDILNARLIDQDSSRRLMLLKYQFEIPEGHNVMYARFLINSTYYYYDIPVNSGVKFPCSQLVPMTNNGWPFFENYLNEGTLINLDRKAFAFQYKDQFSTSKPPMAAPGDSRSNVITIDTTFHADSFAAERERVLTYLQTDSTSNSGCSVLTVSSYYPKLRRVDDLGKAMIYLCKNSEYQKIQNSADVKKAFDRFWVGIIPSQDRARAVIKRYFSHITMANELFSSYKEGWRTDRGMIVTIFGNPRGVKRTDEEEIWSYVIQGKKQNFTFAKVPNLFVQHHYVLVRDKDLSKVWFNEIAKWRKANM
ncbi:MAG: GWxTD domain-containing protein [Cyclobacteriaceae bacterium]